MTEQERENNFKESAKRYWATDAVVMTDQNFESLDRDFDPAIDVAKGEYGTFYVQTNSPAGRMCARIWMHPYMAAKLRDWLNANYRGHASQYIGETVEDGTSL